MRVGLLLCALLVIAPLAGCLTNDDVETGANTAPSEGVQDAVVVAVLDWQMDPYHWDFLAEHMPQHQDDDPANDLPLGEDPSQWLPGFPDPGAFTSYQALNLTLTPDDAEADPNELFEEDQDEWNKVQQTTFEEVHYSYIPGTKVIGWISTVDHHGFARNSHGVGASSVSVGNIHGSCPECLLVFVNLPGAAGEEWVRQQDWIDATSHSYESSTTGYMRDTISDCNTDSRKEAAERGQQIFWAAGNGLMNTFTAPQTTLASCQKGPEWTVTVGAVHPDTKAAYTGHGKPVHVSSLGQSYPSAGGETVTGEGSFGGTSNATPVTAGMYAQALSRLRAMANESERIQRDGTILQTAPGCGDANPDCPLKDGNLTATELRHSLFQAAEHTGPYFHPSAFQGDALPTPGTKETMVWTQGYGAFLARLGDWDAEVQRIVDHATGAVAWEEDPDVKAWMSAYSWCMQQVWGSWDEGHWRTGDALPGPDPSWPLRTWMASDQCPYSTEALLWAHHGFRYAQGMLPPAPPLPPVAAE